MAAADQTAALYMAVYACVAYVAVSFHMSVVQRFGGVVGVLVGNSRKVLTIVLSFLTFPKPLSAGYVVGVALSLGGLTAAVVLGQKKKAGSAKRSRSGQDLGPGAANPVATGLPGHASAAAQLASRSSGFDRPAGTWSANSPPC